MVHDAVFFRNLDALQPGRKALGDVLLPESLGADAGGIPFHREWPPAQMWQDHRRHCLVVRRHVSLGDPVVGEQHLLRMRDHACSLTTSCAFLSKRTPISLGCLSLLLPVHSMNATCTTI